MLTLKLRLKALSLNRVCAYFGCQEASSEEA